MCYTPIHCSHGRHNLHLQAKAREKNIFQVETSDGVECFVNDARFVERLGI